MTMRTFYRIHLEAAEGIVTNFKIVKHTACSVGLVSRAGTPLTATAAATLHSCSRSVATCIFGIAKGIIDESLHSYSAHGIEKVLPS
jgi:hypothetical protein